MTPSSLAGRPVTETPARVHRYETATQDSIRWNAYRPRAGDVIVTTAPKCGTTWTQMLCALLLHGPALPAPLSRLSPEFDRLATPVEALMDEHEKGAEFQLKRADGETVSYRIFV